MSDVSEVAAAPVARASTVPNGDAIPSATASDSSSSSSEGDTASSTSANIHASSTPAALMALKQAIAERDVRIDDLRAANAAHEARAADAAADAARAHTQVYTTHRFIPGSDAHAHTHLCFRYTPVLLRFRWS